MSDRYGKIVLTVIAATLVIIAAEQAVGRAKAAGEQVCGGRAENPCYVRIVNPCWGNDPCMLQ